MREIRKEIGILNETNTNLIENDVFEIKNDRYHDFFIDIYKIATDFEEVESDFAIFSGMDFCPFLRKYILKNYNDHETLFSRFPIDNYRRIYKILQLVFHPDKNKDNDSIHYSQKISAFIANFS